MSVSILLFEFIIFIQAGALLIVAFEYGLGAGGTHDNTGLILEIVDKDITLREFGELV